MRLITHSPTETNYLTSPCPELVFMSQKLVEQREKRIMFLKDYCMLPMKTSLHVIAKKDAIDVGHQRTLYIS